MDTPQSTAPLSSFSSSGGDRTGMSIEAIKRAFLDNLFFVQGKPVALATQHDYYMALAYLVRDRMLQRWNGTAESYTRQGSRTVCYLSAEFLMGPHLGNNLINMGIYDQVKQAMEELGLDFNQLLSQEVEPGLGNGGLGRLAACYWIPWPPWKFPPWGTAFATSSASLSRKCGMAGRWSAPTNGCATATPGKWCDRNGP
jgi:starch phosphorylase